MGTKTDANKIAKGMKYSADVVEGWIEMINAGTKRPLTPFETQFMENVTEDFENRRWLSEGQLETLEGIYANKTD